MRKFKHLDIHDRVILRELLIDDNFKKKNGTINLAKIARYMGRSKNTISYELKHYTQIKRYHPIQSHKRYLNNRKNCVKHIKLTVDQLNWLNNYFNKLHYSPEQICKLYELEYNNKFPMCFKTLYKYIYLGFFKLNKRFLYFRGKRRKIKKALDNRGKLTNYKSVKEANHDKNIFGWFQMDCIVGKEHQSACLVLTEELTKFTICKKLKEQNAKEIVNTLKEIFKNKLLKKCAKGIITDQGKEFIEWKKIEKITNADVYFCDPASPTQKPIVERMNRDIRHWLPKGTDFNKINQNRINWIIQTLDIIAEKIMLDPLLNSGKFTINTNGVTGVVDQEISKMLASFIENDLLLVEGDPDSNFQPVDYIAGNFKGEQLTKIYDWLLTNYYKINRHHVPAIAKGAQQTQAEVAGVNIQTNASYEQMIYIREIKLTEFIIKLIKYDNAILNSRTFNIKNIDELIVDVRLPVNATLNRQLKNNENIINIPNEEGEQE